jgi:hypothetical protein
MFIFVLKQTTSREDEYFLFTPSHHIVREEGCGADGCIPVAQKRFQLWTLINTDKTVPAS